MYDNRGLIRKLAEFNPDLKLLILAPNGKDEVTVYGVNEQDVIVVNDAVVIDLTKHTVTEVIEPVQEEAEEVEETSEVATEEVIEEESEVSQEEVNNAEEIEEKISKKSKKDV